MPNRPSAIFLINLVQDVNVLRPLIIMAQRDFAFDVRLLVSSKFAQRDIYGIWQAELDALVEQLPGATAQTFETPWQAVQHLDGHGLIFAGSESNLSGHRETHEVLRAAPPAFLKVTLQHGFECVGFRHSAAHDEAHGHRVSFAADVLCAWQDIGLLTSMPASQKPKVLVTGPTAVLQAYTDPVERSASSPGIVCENLHSVRLNTQTGTKMEFVDAFAEFCRLLGKGREVALRPHPGGQYFLKNKITLPANARIANAPIYRLDLRQFAYGISAPSSVLLDMLIAGIPTAVWHDDAGAVDVGNYAGLTRVSSPAEWLEFADAAAADSQPFIERQSEFLAKQLMPLDPAEVYENYAQLFRAAENLRVPRGTHAVPRQRVLFVANAHLPTLRVCLERPLASMLLSGELASDLMTEAEVGENDGASALADGGLSRRLASFAPDIIVFSRYSGPAAAELLDWAVSEGIPTVYQIDDDLLAVPRTLGERKFAYHNDPQRLETVRTLLTGVDLVYASTERLRDRLLGYYPDIPVVAGAINCSGRIIRPPADEPARIIGYMASTDHAPNLEMILPAVVETMDRHPQISFEFFGSIPIPTDLERFGDRVRRLPPVSDYEEFLDQFAARNWHIGLCPLTPTEFNLTKSNNKWVEYTSAGVAVVATAHMIYDECCADGCGILAADLDDWRAGLELLVTDDEARVALVERAQHKLETEYSIEQHWLQILEVFDAARARAAERAPSEQPPLQETA